MSSPILVGIEEDCQNVKQGFVWVNSKLGGGGCILL